MEKFIKKITIQAGAILKEKFRTAAIKYTKKDLFDIVTDADLLSNDFLTAAIKKHYPAHGIISEETGEYETDKEYVWIIDPLDGTLNFSTHVPDFGVMVALAKNSSIELATIYCPMFGELVIAKRGEGAFFYEIKDGADQLTRKALPAHGTKITCSQKGKLTESIGCMSASMSPYNTWLWEKFVSTSREGKFIINVLNSIAVEALYLALGRRDWRVSTYGEIWDYAPVSLVLEESGCMVTTLERKPWRIGDRSLLAANPQLHEVLLRILEGHLNVKNGQF